MIGVVLAKPEQRLNFLVPLALFGFDACLMERASELTWLIRLCHFAVREILTRNRSAEEEWTEPIILHRALRRHNIGQPFVFAQGAHAFFQNRIVWVVFGMRELS